MGSGSEVAMEAAQLVLLDNNFASILIAIENGRLVFDNLRKVILFLLPGGSMGCLIPLLMSVFVGVPLNLSSFAVISISLFTDIPPSLCMMREPPETDLLTQPPRTKKDHLADRTFLLQAYGFMGIMVTLFSNMVYFIYMGRNMNLPPNKVFLSFDGIYRNYKEANYDNLVGKYGSNVTMGQVTSDFTEQYYVAQTVTFTSLVILQTFGNFFCTRTHIKSFFQQTPWKRPNGNWVFFPAIVLAVIIQVIIVYVPIFHILFNTRDLPPEYWFIPLAFCVIIFCMDELRKLAARRNFLCFGKVGW
jgi:sodium/potassium-transporting ATPase subunit alpha